MNSEEESINHKVLSKARKFNFIFIGILLLYIHKDSFAYLISNLDDDPFHRVFQWLISSLHLSSLCLFTYLTPIAFIDFITKNSFDRLLSFLGLLFFVAYPIATIFQILDIHADPTTTAGVGYLIIGWLSLWRYKVIFILFFILLVKIFLSLKKSAHRRLS